MNKTKLKDSIRRSIKKTASQRFIELDLLRGLAIMLMIFGHVLWDLDYYDLVPMNNLIYSSLQNFVPPLFFLLIGMCLIVSKKRNENKKTNRENEFCKHLVARGLKIFGLGMVITILTIIFIPERPVFFGVLHCIGICVILSVPFLKYRDYNILFSISIMSASVLVSQYTIENPTILHLVFGLHPSSIWKYTVDYFPLIPWFGVTLLGIVVGDWLYCGEKRMFRIPDLSRYKPAKIFSWVGQHSLGIYLLHQPVIAGTILLFLNL